MPPFVLPGAWPGVNMKVSGLWFIFVKHEVLQLFWEQQSISQINYK